MSIRPRSPDAAPQNSPIRNVSSATPLLQTASAATGSPPTGSVSAAVAGLGKDSFNEDGVADDAPSRGERARVERPESPELRRCPA
jgi:hypothetical protein